MAITKIQSESLNLADDFAFTGTITGAGESNVPSFNALSSSTQSISDNTWTKMTFANEIYDTASAYDTSTSRFTVPSGQGGKYYIGSSTQLYATSAYYEAFSRAYINGSADNSLTVRLRTHFDRPFDANYNQNMYLGGVRVLSAGDYVEIYSLVASYSGGTAINPPSSFFMYKVTN